MKYSKTAPALATGLLMLAVAPVTVLAEPLVHIELTAPIAPNAVGDKVEMTGDGGTSGYGVVPYQYQIGKYEVTVEQYRDFLNAVDPAGTNSLGLYNTYMDPAQDSWGCGIKLTEGVAGGSKYSVVEGYAGKPVNYVNVYDAMRFCNWLTNGQPADGSGTETGVYNLEGGTEIPTNQGVSRDLTGQSGTVYALPSENEWYKAAYYAGNDTYTPYATGAGVSQAQANYWDGGYAYTDGNENHLAPVGTYAEEQNGTFDMMGNVFEWTDTLISEWDGNDYTANNFRGLRGGSLGDYAAALASSARLGDSPDNENVYCGFRVSSLAVPEPSTYGLIGGAVLLGMMMLRRRKNRVTL